MAECQERLALKKVEIEKLLEKDKLIMAEMSQALGEGNKYSEVLLTIFKKKVQRSKPTATPTPTLTLNPYPHPNLLLTSTPQVKRSKRGGDEGDDEDEDDEEEVTSP